MKRVLTMICLALILVSCQSTDSRLRSPYFKDGEFHNMQPPEKVYGFWDYFWKVKGKAQKTWPDLRGYPFERFPKPEEHNPESQVVVTHIFQSSFLVQMEGLNILTDPTWSEMASPFSFMGPVRSRLPAFEIEELPAIDIVLISHNHYDHLDLKTLIQLQEMHHPLFLVGLGNQEFLEEEGLNNVVELDWFEKAPKLKGLQITYAPAQHFSARSPFDHNETLWGSFVLQGNESQIYFAGDSGLGPHFAEIRKRYGVIDLALLPIGAYEPRWFMKYVHMNPAEAVQAHLILGAKQSWGMHYGSIQMTDEGINQPLIDLEQALQKAGLPKEAFITPPFGLKKILPRE